MSFLSILGKIGAGIAAPFTGGASLAAIPVIDAIGKVGSVAGNAAKGSADQRTKESDALLRQQQLLQQQARDQFSAGLQGAQFGREEQDRQRKAQILMQLLSNTKDASIMPGNPAIAARMGTSTGGARPSNLTTNADALLALLQQKGPEAPVYQPPPGMNLPQAGALENILGGVGLGGSLLGAIGGGWKKQGYLDPQGTSTIPGARY